MASVVKTIFLFIFWIWIVLPVSGFSQEETKDKTFYRDSKRGWFWYEKQPEPVKKKKRKAGKHPDTALPSLTDYPRETLWNMHPDEFQALLMQFQKKAVMAPTEDNVYEYLVMQDMAGKKALAYANTVSVVTQTHPELSTKPDYPLTAPGKAAKTRLEQQAVENRLRASGSEFALLYFFSPDCQFCQAQSQILQFFTEKYPFWTIKHINIQAQTDLAARFNVQSVPYMLLVYKNSDRAFPISAGVSSLAEIQLNLYRAIRLLKGEITPQQWSDYEFQKGASIEPVVNK